MIYVISGEGDIDKEIPGVKGEYYKMMFPDNGMHPNEQIKIPTYNLQTKQSEHIVVYTYSPYLIEAFVRFSDPNNIKFYYFDGDKLITENALSLIFESLSEPFEVFREQDKEKLNETQEVSMWCRY